MVVEKQQTQTQTQTQTAGIVGRWPEACTGTDIDTDDCWPRQTATELGGSAVTWHYNNGSLLSLHTAGWQYLPLAHEAKSQVKQLVHLYPSVYKRPVYNRNTTWFQLNIIFWTQIEKQTCHVTLLWLWIWPDRTCAEERDNTLTPSAYPSNKIENHSKQET